MCERVLEADGTASFCSSPFAEENKYQPKYFQMFSSKDKAPKAS